MMAVQYPLCTHSCAARRPLQTKWREENSLPGSAVPHSILGASSSAWIGSMHRQVRHSFITLVLVAPIAAACATLSDASHPYGTAIHKAKTATAAIDKVQISGALAEETHAPGQPRQIPKRPVYDKKGIASWYGDSFAHKRTADGEIFHAQDLTAAHRTLPMGAIVLVTNLANMRAVAVRINDRGPRAKNRIIDVSRRVAKLLGFYRRGTAPVRVTYFGKVDHERKRIRLASPPVSRRAQ